MTATFIEPFARSCDGPFDGSFAGSCAGPFDVRLKPVRPCHAVYVRRRLMAALVFVALLAVVGLAAHSALADRGGVPASIPAIRPDIATARYVVQPGDTLWSIADRLRGQANMSDYVDRLVSANGGASVQAGQLLSLP